MDPSSRLPPDLVEHARAFASGEREPSPAVDASTVLLLREGSAGPEVYLLRRHAQMAFAAGMYAFPGGRVDPRDLDHTVGWAGPPATEWADLLRCDEVRARALVCAAVRETFEESGVLLAGADESSLVSDTTGDDWERDRVALVAHSVAFSDFLASRGLVLRSDLLRLWAHWVTPEFEPRRYDTRFFLAALPSGQRTRDVSGEADRVEWRAPGGAVAAAETGEMQMLPPTYVTLAELSAYDTIAAALDAAADREIVTVLPRVAFDGDDGRLVHDGVPLP